MGARGRPRPARARRTRAQPRLRAARVTGLVFYGAQLVIAADDERALDAFAVETRKHRGLRSFVGPKHAVDGIWDRVRDWHPPARARARTSSRSTRSCPQALRCGDARRRGAARARGRGRTRRRTQRRDDLGRAGLRSARERARSSSPRVRRAIAHGLWWVWIVDGELRFQCNVGPRTLGDGAAARRLDAARATRPRIRARSGWPRSRAACSPRRRRSRSTSTTSTRRRSRCTSASASAASARFATYLFP